MLCFGGCFSHARHNSSHAFQCDAFRNGFRLGHGALDQPLGGFGGLGLFRQKFFNLVHETKLHHKGPKNTEQLHFEGYYNA